MDSRPIARLCATVLWKKLYLRWLGDIPARLKVLSQYAPTVSLSNIERGVAYGLRPGTLRRGRTLIKRNPSGVVSQLGCQALSCHAQGFKAGTQKLLLLLLPEAAQLGADKPFLHFFGLTWVSRLAIRDTELATWPVTRLAIRGTEWRIFPSKAGITLL